ncbi:hypothetical protein LCGC14_0420560 [marine sediment metagenome]|uniref:Uncharacterized protein n=1 Tax=marine sediment metagenome TaxID=412755 RepID=A0A0F9T926_9ZZZZ
MTTKVRYCEGCDKIVRKDGYIITIRCNCGRRLREVSPPAPVSPR